MIILSQRDPRWAQKHLGASSLTVGRYGCTTSCISMLSDYFGCYKSPLELAQEINLYTKPGNPLGEGLVIWEYLNKIFKGMAFDHRQRGRFDQDIMLSLKDPNKACILQVDNGQHWVVALGKTLFRNDYRIADPWFGDKRTALGTYRNITGSAHFVRK